MAGQPVLDDTSSVQDTDTVGITFTTHTPGDVTSGDITAFITVSAYNSAGVSDVYVINYGTTILLSWGGIFQDPDEIFEIGTITYDSGTRRISMFRCSIPAGGLGAYPLTVNMVSQVDALVIGCTTYSNSDPSSPIYSSVISTGTGLTASLVLSTLDNTSQKVIGILGTTGLTVTKAADQTELYEEIIDFTTLSSDEDPDGTTTTHAYSLGGIKMWGMIVAAFVHPASFDVSLTGVASVTSSSHISSWSRKL